MKSILSTTVLLCCLAAARLCSATPPTLSTPTVVNVGAGMATLVLQSSAAGTGYFTLMYGSGMPCGTGSQVQAGHDSSGIPAPYHGSLTLAAGKPGRYTVRNLSESTSYTVCFTADSPSGQNLNQVPVASSFTTMATADLGWEVVGGSVFSASDALLPTLAIAPDGTPTVAYVDYANAGKVTVMQFNGVVWDAVGNAGFTEALAIPWLAIAPDGNPAVATVGLFYGGIASVLKFNGKTWEVLGGTGFAESGSGISTLAYAPDGTPAVAYLDSSNGKKVTVMQYRGGAWEVVGSAGFSAGEVNSSSMISLAFAQDGTPYVAFQDSVNGNRATVMAYHGGAWEVVGSAGFSAGELGSSLVVSLAIAPDGAPCVAYQDSANGNRATVMEYRGNAWQAVGNAGFSSGEAQMPWLAIGPDGTPTVAYTDLANDGKATVMEYRGGTWVPVGNVAFSSGKVMFTFLAFAPDGIPFMSYMDVDNGNKGVVMSLMPQKPAAATTVSSDINPVLVGGTVTFTAAVTPGAATGTVTFRDGVTTLATVPLVNGVATCSASFSAAGTHSITAVYSGDSTYGLSVSAPLTLEVLNPISVTVTSDPPGLNITVDGTSFTAPHTFSWMPGSSHTLATGSPQDAGSGTRYVWSSWSDNGALAHTVLPTAVSTFTVIFAAQYTLTTTITGNGTVKSGGGINCSGSPQSGTCSAWYNSGALVALTASVRSSVFSGWGGASVSCGSALSCQVTVDAQKTCSATFVASSLVFISGTSQTFTNLQPAYAAAANGAVIKAQGVSFGEDLLLDTAGRSVTIKGGYEPTFTSQSGYSSVKKLTIGRGGLVADRVTIR